jgi:CRP-like cAMP-binding protein
MDMELHEIWTNHTKELKQRLQKNSHLMDFKRGDPIYRSGDRAQDIFEVESGLVGLVQLGASSRREHLLRFFRSQQIFGHRAFFSQENYHATAVALESTRVRRLDGAIVRQVLKEHPDLLWSVIQVLATELRRAEDQRLLILENEILARVGLSLVYLKKRHPEHTWTRLEIANFCASTESTVIKALSQLEARGLIRQEKRNIEILDWEALVALQESS